MLSTAFYIFLGFLAITFFDLPYLLKNKKIKELIVYFIILGLAFLISVLHVTRIVRFDWLELMDSFFQLFIKT